MNDDGSTIPGVSEGEYLGQFLPADQASTTFQFDSDSCNPDAAGGYDF